MHYILLLATVLSAIPVSASPRWAPPPLPFEPLPELPQGTFGNAQLVPRPAERLARLRETDRSWEWFRDQTGIYGIRWSSWKTGQYGNRYAAVKDLSEGIGGTLVAVGVNCDAFKIAWNQEADAGRTWTNWERPISRSVSEQVMLKLCEAI